MRVNSVLEQMLFTTVRITTVDSAGSTGLGTGFTYQQVLPNGQSAQALITNKHVVAGAVAVTLHFISADADGDPHLGHEFTITVQNPAANFIGHPDLDVDVTLLPLGNVFDQVNAQGARIFTKSIGPELIATPELLEAYEPIEPVTFIGYPNGLYDTTSLLPIARRGHSATALNVDYEGKPIFLIDASVFPGSSGSPVFLWTPPGSADKSGSMTIGGPGRLLLLGVVAAVYQRQVPVLTSAATQPFVHDALDIGIVYKATTVRDLVNLAIAQS